MNAHPLDEHGLPQGYAFREDWEVTPRQVQAMREQGESFVLLDCRTPAEANVASIEGAQLVPLQELPHRLGELEQFKAQKVVVMCHLGGRSLRATAFLRQQGFADVTSMAGGIELWARDIDPAIARY